MLLLSLSICVSAHLVDDFLLMLFCFLLLKDNLLAFLIVAILLTPLRSLDVTLESRLVDDLLILTSFLTTILLIDFIDLFCLLERRPGLSLSLVLALSFLLFLKAALAEFYIHLFPFEVSILHLVVLMSGTKLRKID